MDGIARSVTFLLLVLIGFGVAWFAHGSAVGNWDAILYVAGVLKLAGLEGAELHRESYAAMRAAFDAATFDSLIGDPAATSGHPYYRHTVYSDPDSFAQMLPFYGIRVVYIRCLALIAPLVGGPIAAMQVLGAACAGAMTCLAGLLLMRGPWPLPPVPALIVLPLLVAATGVITVGQLATPDALSSLIVLIALALLHSHRLAALVLVALLPLVRSDGVLLAALVGVLLWIERDRRAIHYVLLGVAVAIYLLIGRLYGGYGHLLLFNFSLLNDGPDPYPATMAISTDPRAYLEVYVRRTIAFAPTLMYLLIVLLVALADLRAPERRTPMAATACLAIAYAGVHFLLFPVGEVRYYVFALVYATAYALKTLHDRVRAAGAG